jgi:hypothetical protein
VSFNRAEPTYPGTLAQRVKTKLVSDFGSVHGVLLLSMMTQTELIGFTYGKILLVGEDKEKGIAQLILVEHALQLLASLDNTIPIVGVDDKDNTLSVLEVVPPQRANLVLPTNIPHGELNVLVLDSLNVET